MAHEVQADGSSRSTKRDNNPMNSSSLSSNLAPAENTFGEVSDTKDMKEASSEDVVPTPFRSSGVENRKYDELSKKFHGVADGKEQSDNSQTMEALEKSIAAHKEVLFHQKLMTDKEVNDRRNRLVADQDRLLDIFRARSTIFEQLVVKLEERTALETQQRVKFQAQSTGLEKQIINLETKNIDSRKQIITLLEKKNTISERQSELLSQQPNERIGMTDDQHAELNKGETSTSANEIRILDERTANSDNHVSNSERQNADFEKVNRLLTKPKLESQSQVAPSKKENTEPREPNEHLADKGQATYKTDCRANGPHQIARGVFHEGGPCKTSPAGTGSTEGIDVHGGKKTREPLQVDDADDVAETLARLGLSIDGPDFDPELKDILEILNL